MKIWDKETEGDGVNQWGLTGIAESPST